MTDPCDSWPYTVPYGLGRAWVAADRADFVTLENFDARTATPKLATFLNHIRTDWSRWSGGLDWTLESGPDDAPSCIEIEVPYNYRGGCGDYFAGGCWNPGDAPEVETGVAWFIDDAGVRCEVVLLEPETERVEAHIYNNPPDDDYPEDWE